MRSSLEVIPPDSHAQPKGSSRIRLLVIGHDVVVAGNQELWTAVARQYPEIAVEILCPAAYYYQGLARAEALDARLVPVHRLPSPFARSGRQHLHFYMGLGSVLDRVRPDYVYCAEEPNSLVTAQVVRACERRAIPVVFWTALNQLRDYRRMYGWLNPRRHLFPRCQRYVFDHCVGAVATNREAVDVLRAQGFRKSITYRSTHAVGTRFLDVGRRRMERQPAPADPLRIGFVGAFHDHKGIDVLLQAFARMRNRARARLVLRGKGPEEQPLRRLAAQLGATGEVTWRPLAAYRDMPGVYAGLDVLVLPSLQRGAALEQFGRVIIEAMASGAVAVGSRIGGIPSALAGGGLLFEPGDADQLAGILDRLCADGAEWKRWQTRGFKTVQDVFSCAVVGRNLLEGLRRDIGWFASVLPLDSRAACGADRRDSPSTRQDS